MAIFQSQWQDLPEQVGGPFDLVLCLGNAIVHAGSSPGRISAFEGMKQVLDAKGTLIVDSRNWELLYKTRPRIVPVPKVIERHGLRCSSFYIWTIPDNFESACTAEIVLLFEDSSAMLSYRRHVIEFTPFRHGDLADDIRSAGFVIQDDSYDINGDFYSIAAAIG